MTADATPSVEWRGASRDLYDTIGVGYRSTRVPDPRLAAQINRHLGEGASVVNVGAGSGSYEPPWPGVVAVEPSPTMLAQRPSTAAPAVRAGAEALPFRDGSFDVGLAIFTVHHWLDPLGGLLELKRVAKRQVILNFDPEVHYRHWLIEDYFPMISEVPGTITMEQFRDSFGECTVETVMVPADCVDGFFGAYWRRPEQYLDPGVRAGMSYFGRLDPDLVTPGIERLARDLESGRWRRAHGDLLDLDVLDVGIRLIIAG